MGKRLWWSAVAIGLAVALVAACGGDDSGSSSEASTTSAATGASGAALPKGDPIKVGAVLELSGSGAGLGASAKAALEGAVRNLNKSGGVEIGGKSHDFELTVSDAKTDPSAALSAANELMIDKKVKIIFGPILSALAPSVAQAVTPKGVIIISDAAALSPLIAGDAVKTTGKLIFRSLYPDQPLLEASATAMQTVYPNVKRVSFVLADDATGRNLPVKEGDELKSRGLEVVATEFVPNTGTDFQTVLTRVRDTHPDLMWLCCTAGTLTGIIRQSVELGIGAKFIYWNLSLSIPLKDATGSPVPVDTAVVYQPSVLERLPSGEIITAKAGVKQFADDVIANGGTIDSNSALGFNYFYDTVGLVAAAMEKAGTSDDTDAIAKALEEVEVDGASGRTGFGPDHQWEPDPDVCLVPGGGGQPKCQTIPKANWVK